VPVRILGADYKYQAGQKVGTIAQINDMTKADFDDDADRAIYYSQCEDPNSWAIAGHWYIELSAQSAMPPEPEPEPAAAAEPAAAPAPAAPAPAAPAPSPSTGNTDIVIFLSALVISAMGLAFVLRRRMNSEKA
jgi:LPXTG-motif cell wall-anchored protein